MLLKKTIRLPKTGRSLNSKTERLIKHKRGVAINFYFATSYLPFGAKIYRVSWEEENSYIYMKDDLLLHNKPYHKHQRKIKDGYPYVLSKDDINAEDWMIFYD
jgi:predicted metallo-beta-lactamase superfamily hydrolase